MSLFEYIFNHKLRVLSLFLINTVSLLISAQLIPGIGITSVSGAAITIFVIAIVNVLIRPLLLKIISHLPLILFILTGLFLDAIILYLVANVFNLMQIETIFEAFVLSVVVSVVNTIATSLFHIDEVDSYYQNVIRKIAKKPRGKVDKRGCVIMQIDGLSAPLLEEELKLGKMPYLGKMISDKSHNLVEWECDLPSMTSASQAGIMYGHHDNIPAFRWFDKTQGKLLVSNHPKDASFIDSFLSKNRKGLLTGGTSINNLFTGGAKHSVMTMSQIVDTEGERKIKNEDFNDYLGNPYNVTRSLVLMALEILVEYKEAVVQKVTKVKPRGHRGGSYPFLRAAVCVLLRDMTTYLVIADIYRGTPIIYADYLGYDEVSHHSGVKTIDARRVLRKLDKTIATLQKAIEVAGNNYDLVLLSDHGQSWGNTFKQKFGKSLQELIQELTSQEVTLVKGSDESRGQVNTMFAETANQKGVVGKTSKKIVKEQKEVDVSKSNVVVCASGNLAQIYFTQDPKHLSFEEINKLYPGLLDGLVNHPGIGIVMVTDNGKPKILQKDGVNPVSDFPKSTEESMDSLGKYSNLGDITIISSFNTKTQEVHAFEELIGSHGGAGGWQTRPFLVYPSNWSDPGHIYGAGKIYNFLTKNLSAF